MRREMSDRSRLSIYYGMNAFAVRWEIPASGWLCIFWAEKNLKNKKEAVRGKWWAEKILKMKKEAVRLDANLLRKG